MCLMNKRSEEEKHPFLTKSRKKKSTATSRAQEMHRSGTTWFSFCIGTHENGPELFPESSPGICPTMSSSRKTRYDPKLIGVQQNKTKYEAPRNSSGWKGILEYNSTNGSLTISRLRVRYSQRAGTQHEISLWRSAGEFIKAVMSSASSSPRAKRQELVWQRTDTVS